MVFSISATRFFSKLGTPRWTQVDGSRYYFGRGLSVERDRSPLFFLPACALCVVLSWCFLCLFLQVFFGAPAALPAYCTGLGKTPPAYSNIGEFFLEVVDEYEAADNVKVRRRGGRRGRDKHTQGDKRHRIIVSRKTVAEAWLLRHVALTKLVFY